MAASLAMCETGGRMITFDSYIEERHNHCFAYTELSDVYDKSADAYRGLEHISRVFGLETVLSQQIGRSPEGVAPTVRAQYGVDKLDYVMIDAEHTDAGLTRDLEAVCRFLAENHAIFIHDAHCFKPELVCGGTLVS